MSDLKKIPPIPKETSRAANAIFGRSNFYIMTGEHLETILDDIQPPSSSESEGIVGVQEAIPMLITFFQFVEGLTDVQAVDAVRTRTDWKFALHLSLIPGIFHENALCEFRRRVLADPVHQEGFQKLINRLIVFVPVINNEFQTLKHLEVIRLVCSINRLNRAQQTMHQVLQVLATKFPDWLRKNALPHWYGRYNHATPRLDIAILLGQQRFFVEEIGADIYHLLEEVHHTGLREISELDEVKMLNQVWLQQFQTLNASQNLWPEMLNLRDCEACASVSAGRRQET